MVTVLFQTESHFPVDRVLIKNAIEQVLAQKLRSASEVSVTIVGDRKMHDLNKRYRNIDDTTDVLSFPLNDPADTRAFIDAPDGVLRLGDIIVSYPQAVSEASAENILVDDKIVYLVLHGLNHLLGIHHPE